MGDKGREIERMKVKRMKRMKKSNNEKVLKKKRLRIGEKQQKQRGWACGERYIVVHTVGRCLSGTFPELALARI